MEHADVRSERGVRDYRAYSTRELVDEVVGQSQRLVREELNLAKSEMRDQARSAARGGASVGAGGVLAFAALLVVCFAAVYALALAMPAWLAALIVGVVVGVAAAVLIQTGKKRLKAFRPTPQETVGTLQEDKRWAKETIRSAKSVRHAHA